MISSAMRLVKHGLTAVSLAVAALPLGAAAEELWHPYSSGLGADGYDVVAYFGAGEAVKGSKKHAADHGGTKWLFSSKENLEAFNADPAKYAPQYGGYCAYAMGKGYKAFGDPQVWTVHEGRLFFNYNVPTRKAWNSNQEEFISSADTNWPKVVASSQSN